MKENKIKEIFLLNSSFGFYTSDTMAIDALVQHFKTSLAKIFESLCELRPTNNTSDLYKLYVKCQKTIVEEYNVSLNNAHSFSDIETHVEVVSTLLCDFANEMCYYHDQYEPYVQYSKTSKGNRRLTLYTRDIELNSLKENRSSPEKLVMPEQKIYKDPTWDRYNNCYRHYYSD